LYGGLDREDFSQGQFLCALGREATVSTEDDIDYILWVFKILSPRFVTLVVVVLILSLSVLRKGWIIE
jgi:hypothetical protein